MGAVALGLLAWRIVVGVRVVKPPTVEKIPTVGVATPFRRPVEIDLSFVADVVPIMRANLTAQMTGVVSRVFVDLGSVVKTGQLLVELDKAELQAEVAQTEHALAQATANLVAAKGTAERTQALLGRHLVATQDAENAQAAFEADRALAEASRAGLAAARARLSYADIRAPFPGSIAKRGVDPGALVSPQGPALVELVRTDRVKVYLQVPERDMDRVTVGMLSRLGVDALPGHSFEGRVARISAALDPSSRMLETEVDFDNPNGKLRPGLFGNVQLVAGMVPNAIMVPADAVVFTEGGDYVYVLRGDRVHRARVRAQREVGDLVQVTEGLEGDETIVVSGVDLIADDAKVVAERVELNPDGLPTLHGVDGPSPAKG